MRNFIFYFNKEKLFMKPKSKKFLKITALFLCIMMILPMLFACGEKPAENAATDAPAEGGNVTEPTPEPATPEPTPEPTTPEPTEPPTTIAPFVPDASLSYWEQIYTEFEYYGFKDGVKLFTGETEEELMKKFSAGNCKKEELDVSGDASVPFSAAYKVYTIKDMENFWDASYGTTFSKDLPLNEGDIIAGVIWLKDGRRTGESENFDADDAVMYHLAVKTPTDWGTESNMQPAGDIMFDEDIEGWQKIFFTAEVMFEEDAIKTNNMIFNLYIGWGLQEFEVGGIIAWGFPLTQENEDAIWKLPID